MCTSSFRSFSDSYALQVLNDLGHQQQRSRDRQPEWRAWESHALLFQQMAARILPEPEAIVQAARAGVGAESGGAGHLWGTASNRLASKALMMIDRRTMMAGTGTALLSAASGVRAQTAARIYRIGVFDYAFVSPTHPNALAFFDELQRRGYVQGQNLIVERRDAGGRPDRVAEVARELVAWRPDLITASTAAPNLALKEATKSIPIVMSAVADPVGSGLVTSLVNPGGNITGVALLVPENFTSKQLQLLHDAVPSAKRIAVFVNPDNPMTPSALSPLAPAAQRLGIELRILEIRAAHEVPGAVDAARRAGCHAVLVPGDQTLVAPSLGLGQLVTGAGLALMSISRRQAEDKGLMSYGPDFLEMYRRAASMAARLLQGARPADLPIESPTKYELVLNLKTANALGLTIPKSVMLLADVIVQ